MSKIVKLSLWMILFAVATSGCDREPPTIAVVLPLTGEDAALGEAAKRGLEVAAADLEAKAGVTFTLEFADSQSDPEMAAQKLAQLFDDTNAVTAIGGLTSRDARALAEVAEREEKVLLMPSASEQHLRVASQWVYQLAPSDGSAGSTFASFATRHYKAASAIILAQDQIAADDMREGFEKTFTSLEGEIQDALIAEAGDALASAGQQVREANADVVVITGDPSWQIQAVEQLEGVGYGGKIFAPRSFSHPAIVETLGKGAEGIHFAYSDFSTDDTRPHVQDFVSQYQARFNEPPDLIAAESWDALHIAALAYADRAAIASEIRRGLRDQVKNYAGASGTLEFDESGGVAVFPRVYSLNADLEMRDHGVLLDEQREAIEEQQREIARRKQELLRQLNNVGNG